MDTREPGGGGTGASATGDSGSMESASAKQEVKSLLSEAKQETSRLAETAKEKVTDTAVARKDAAAETIGTVADVLRDAGQRLQEETALGRYAETAADQVERLSQYLRRKDLGGMMRDAETFARRHPELFLGVAFLGGIAAARFLKSSAPRPETPREPAVASPEPPAPAYRSGYGPGYGAGYGYAATTPAGSGAGDL
jgi:hypothetical protein